MRGSQTRMGLMGLLTKGGKKSIGIVRSPNIGPIRPIGLIFRLRTTDYIVAATVGPGQSDPSFDWSPSARVLTSSS